MQCVIQKGNVLGSPGGGGEGTDGSRKGKGTPSGVAGKAKAHPIMGWKGFEDIIESIPGETVDVVSHTPINRNREPFLSATGSSKYRVPLGPVIPLTYYLYS